MKQIKFFIILIFSFCFSAVYSQHYSKGLLLDDDELEKIPQKPTLLTRDYKILPSSYSLLPYCPIPKNQEDYGTCVAWSTTYAARTIAEAIANNWQNKDTITAHAFSPMFTFAQVKKPQDYNCQEGAFLSETFSFLKKNGSVKFDEFNTPCPSSIPPSLKEKGKKSLVDDYFVLFKKNDSDKKKIMTTKKSISENRPVVVSMLCYDSFEKKDEIVWSGIPDKNEGGHAMCVAAYDDNKFGGAFLLMNSWGTNWGENGFKWVKYDDYATYARSAIEMYVKKKGRFGRNAENKIVVNSVNLLGELRFVLATGEEMNVSLQSKEKMPHYKLKESYISGTRYRLYISNNEPAYVYVIGSDLNNSVTKIFPPNDDTSAALVYKSNNIAIPDENWYIEMDNTAGKDYMCVLYSEKELPVDEIIKNIKNAEGTFIDKINHVLSDNIISSRLVFCDSSTIQFQVRNAEKPVLPIVVEIEHR